MINVPQQTEVIATQQNSSDMQWCVLQAGIIAFRRNSTDVQLCVSYKPRSGSWKIQKGCVESGDTLSQTALNEALEEAGIHGHLVGDSIGTYNYTKRGNNYLVVMYMMHVTAEDDNWEEKVSRERHWLSPRAALHYLSEHPAYPLVERAIEVLVNHDEGG
jgi:8-oxo-dGTP pyrophosphatase MutT (NUDIX family)